MLPPGVDIVSELWWSTTRRMIRTAIGDYKQLQSTTTGKGAKEEAERLLRGHYLAEARKGRLPVIIWYGRALLEGVAMVQEGLGGTMQIKSKKCSRCS
eukprot:g7305.t1